MNPLRSLLERGYMVLHVRDELTRAPLLGLNFEGTLPPLEAVTLENLAFDLSDARHLAERRLGCGRPPELAAAFPHWSGCNFLPEDLHPQSFRACFGHNTNVWATLARDAVQVSGKVGVHAPEQPATDWYGRDSRTGMGRRVCKHIEARFQVRHRCRCSDAAVCGSEAALVEALAKRKLMPPAAPASGPA